MSAADKSKPATTPKSAAGTNSEYRISGGPWAASWKIAAVLGVLGLAGAGAAFAGDPRRFAFSYLFAFVFFLTLALGALVFVLLQHLTSAAWSVTVRRTAEFFMAGLPVFALLFVPILASMGQLYPWTHLEHAPAHHASAGEHGEGTVHAGAPEPSQPGHEAVGDATGTGHLAARGAGTAHGEAGAQLGPDAEQAHILHKKAGYLNKNFFLLRALIYFVVWFWLSRRFFSWSTRQDTTKDPALTVRAQRFAPAATFLFGLTLTFAAFDWIMSLNPMWYSTIFGVWIFAGGIVTLHAVLTLVALSLRATKLTGKAINVEHFHDLGKLTFGFLVFWAYISFSQFFLTWYASIPEETVFYHHRWGLSPWRGVSVALILGNFVLPFFVLLSRNAKRRLPMLGVGAAIIAVMHVVESYWIVMPNFFRASVFETESVATLAVSWVDLACFFGIGGVYLAVVFFLMNRHPLIPVGDPRLARSLRFENA